MKRRNLSLLLVPLLLAGALALIAVAFTSAKTDLDTLGGVARLADREGPQIAVGLPEGVLRGVVTATVTLDDPSGALLALLALDDQPLTAEEGGVAIDTTALPDGEHRLVVEAEDRSLWGNRNTVVVYFVTHNAPPLLDVKVDPPAIGLGHVGTVTVTADEPFDLAATLDGRAQPVFKDGEGYWTILAFGSTGTPGPRQLRLTATDALGNQREETTTVVVAPVTYPIGNVDLPDYVTPLLAPEIVEKESALLAQVFASTTPDKLWDGLFGVPTAGWVSSEFGERRSYNNGPPGVAHGGVDLATGAGAPVAAANGGRVVLAQRLAVRGNTVVVDHGLGVFSAYCHLAQIAVQEGQSVAQGDLLGRVGSTGLSTGPHLHWEVRVGGEAVMPAEWTERAIGPPGRS